MVFHMANYNNSSLVGKLNDWLAFLLFETAA
jgi:hypothetical protein